MLNYVNVYPEQSYVLAKYCYSISGHQSLVACIGRPLDGHTTMLADLPAELLNQIVSYSPATSISHLSQSSRYLNNFVEKEGWRTFAQSNFSALKYPPCWRDAAHALTTLSRNWQRRAFVAQFLEPAGDVTAVATGLPLKKWKRPGGQTMGFQPAVDSHQELIGDKWHHRREIMAWSAGAELVVRVRLRNTETEDAYRNASPQKRQEKYEANGMRVRWWSYRPFSAVEGRDDITSVKILKTGGGSVQGHNSIHDQDQIIIGTANGDLQLIQMPADEGGPIKTYFVTNGTPVRSISLCPGYGLDDSSTTLLAANLSDLKLALYKVDSGIFKIAPLCKIDAMPLRQKGCRIWSTQFLDPNRLAIGLGPSVEPVNVFAIRPEGIVQEPIRKIGFSGDADALDPIRASSIYPIETLVDSNGSRGDGNVFMSGGYDGIIRLHDLRSPSSYETLYRDPTDDAAVYSLLSRGRDKIIAGTSRHCLLKIFDLRVSGGSQYDYAEVAGVDDSANCGGDWNIFINPRERYANSSWRGPNSWMRRSAEGSIYSLTSPSPTSPFVYAGVENAVVEFNFSSVRDQHPDTIFSACNYKKSKPEICHKPMWLNSRRDVLNLAMYSQGTDDSREAMKLRTQRSVDDTLAQETSLAGLDERWKDNQ